MLRRALGLMLLCFPLAVFAQKMQTVSGEYTYYAPESVSVEAAKNTALERAKQQLIAGAFGTAVGVNTTTRVTNRNGQSEVEMISVGDSEVRGEWIETLGEPRYTVAYEQGLLVVTVSVAGRIREVAGARIDIDARILRNGTADKFESSDFHSGDDLFLAFQTPVAGYLTVYLYDGEDAVYCLLPYREQDGGRVAVEAGRRYLFFSQREAEEALVPFTDEYTMTCSRPGEMNRIYVVFSPNKFIKANDNASLSEELPRELDYRSFLNWLTRSRKQDTEMVVQTKPIVINP